MPRETQPALGKTYLPACAERKAGEQEPEQFYNTNMDLDSQGGLTSNHVFLLFISLTHTIPKGRKEEQAQLAWTVIQIKTSLDEWRTIWPLSPVMPKNAGNGGWRGKREHGIPDSLIRLGEQQAGESNQIYRKRTSSKPYLAESSAAISFYAKIIMLVKTGGSNAKSCGRAVSWNNPQKERTEKMITKRMCQCSALMGFCDIFLSFPALSSSIVSF